MQLSGLHRRHPAPAFINHTPKDFEITSLDPSLSSELFFAGPTGMAVGAAPFYTEDNMGQAPSAVEREALRKASSTILREDSIVQTEEDCGSYSRPDSWSMHHTCTNQAPYSDPTKDMMMTQESLLRASKANTSHDLAYFLRTTGPTAPHRRPSKLSHSKRGAATSKQPFRFLKMVPRRPTDPVVRAHDRLNGVLRDEGGLLMKIPEGVEQKETAAGKRYLALQVQSSETPRWSDRTTRSNDENICKIGDNAPVIGPNILDSRVSVSLFAEDFEYSNVNSWLVTSSRDEVHSRHSTPPRKPSNHSARDDESTVRVVYSSSSPIRPAASNPPTPQPDSAVSMADSYRNDLPEHPASRNFSAATALSSHPIHALPIHRLHPSATRSPPKIALPREEFPVKHPSAEKLVDIKHPAPRRFASHPVLLQRASSIASSLYPRSVSDSPGPPPPRSPLRALRRDPRTIESIMANYVACTSSPKLAPSITPICEHVNEQAYSRPMITTDCTGPIKRPRSRGEHQNLVTHPAYPVSRKEREERIRVRKLRDRPYTARTIDAIVNSSPPLTRQRLRKARPQIMIPDLRPAPLVTRASSSASSTASWKKVTESTRTPVSPVPSQECLRGGGEKTGYSPVSPTASMESASNRDSRMALSPVMLVAEEISIPKSRLTPKPAKLILKDGKSYAPRPRSASISRAALNHRSRNGGAASGHQTPARSGSPVSPISVKGKEVTPPLPSPPPNRALPPTPPASGSERSAVKARLEKHLPIPPLYEISPKANTPPKRAEYLPHVATQRKSTTSSKDSGKVSSRFDARLEALEKQNALLSAALMAVLKTNGALNAPLSSVQAATKDAAVAEVRTPTAWESRIARRSAASHAASSSCGSALDMYMTTHSGMSGARGSFTAG